jgi:hypothetical protein
MLILLVLATPAFAVPELSEVFLLGFAVFGLSLGAHWARGQT